MLNHILVAIDQSPVSQQAFTTALELAQALNATITLIHALDAFDPASPERPNIPVDSYSMELDEIVRKNYEHEWSEFVNHYDALLKQLQEQAAAVGVRAHYLQPYGHTGPVICKTAATANVDLIVVGSHGRTGLTEMLLGSVSNYIMHHAACSVLIVHEPSASTVDAETEAFAVADR